MERHIVKYAEDPVRLEVRDERLAELERRQDHIEHVIGLLTLGRDYRQAYTVFHCPSFQMVVVPGPDSPALLLDFLAGLELRQQKGCQKIGRKVARPNVDPAVFIHLATEELASVGALFPNNQRTLYK